MDAMSIGEAARTVGVSAKAIRLWEARGLLPAAHRTRLGHRAYTDADLTTLHFIRRAKSLGLTLGEIGDVTRLQQAGEHPCARVLQAIDARLCAIERQIADLQDLRETLVAAQSAAEAEETRGSASGCRIIESVDL